LLLDRVDARAVERHGSKVVPKRWKAKRAIGELARGTNALKASTKGANPQTRGFAGICMLPQTVA